MNDDLRSSEAAPGPGHGRAVVLFALVGLLAYFNSLHGDYLLDDHRFTNDPKIDRPLHGEMKARPVIAVSLALNHMIDGLNPRGYHAVNLAAHILAGLLVYDVVRRTMLASRFGGRFESTAGWFGLLAGLVWMAHPLNTQSVTYIIQRCESFMGLFLLAALWCYVRGASAERGTWWWIAAFACCALGAGCKEMMIVLAPLALLYDRTFLTGSWRESLRRRWAVLLALVVPPIAGLAALAFTGFFTDPSGTVGFGVKLFTPFTYALTQTEVILHYLRLCVFPRGLTLDYLDWKPCRSLAECWPSVAAVAGIAIVTAVGVIMRAAWAFPAAWFLACLAPSSSIVPVQDAAFEHRMYLPLIGVVTLVVCGLGSLVLAWKPGAGRALGIAGGLVVFALALLTAARNEDYATSTALLRSNAELRPENGRVRLNLAIDLFATGDVAGAEAQLDDAMKLQLQAAALRGEYVKVLRESGRTADAVAMARKVLETEPDSATAEYELGLSLLADGSTAEALPLLARAAEKKADVKFTRLHYAIALQQTGGGAKAAQEFAATRALDSEYAKQLSQVARRVSADPDAKPSHIRLAERYADAAVRMTDSPPPEMLDTLAMCQARVGRFEDAAATAVRAAAAARAAGDDYQAKRLEARAARFRERKTNLPDERSSKP